MDQERQQKVNLSPLAANGRNERNMNRFKSHLKTTLKSAMATNSLRWMGMTAASSKRLDGKVAIVTGSTKGIGLATAEKLAADGAKVVISSRKQNNVDEAVKKLKSKGLNVSGITCHVGKKKDRENLIKHALDAEGKFDILVSNAAVNPAVGFLFDTSEDAWDKIFDVNVKAAFMLSKEALPYMRKKGSIVYVSSIAGFQVIPILAAYSVSKTALLGLTKAAAYHCASMEIRVNGVAPGIVKTDFSSALWQEQEMYNSLVKDIPLQRIAEPHDISGLISFLCSDDAAYITGENFVVAGGMPSKL